MGEHAIMAMLARLTDGGTVLASCLATDGEVEAAGELLVRCYEDADAVKELTGLGVLTSLGSMPEECVTVGEQTSGFFPTQAEFEMRTLKAGADVLYLWSAARGWRVFDAAGGAGTWQQLSLIREALAPITVEIV